jgi:hypothetical protein
MSGIGMEAAPSLWGLQVVHQKTVGLLGWATKQRLSGRRRDPGVSRSFDTSGHAAGLRGLRWENMDCGEGVAA